MHVSMISTFGKQFHVETNHNPLVSLLGLKEIHKAKEANEICQKPYQYCKNRWPHRQSIAGTVQPYISVGSDITVNDGLLLKCNRIIIPSVIRLDKFHSSHWGTSV